MPTIRESIESQIADVERQIAQVESRWDTLDSSGTQHAEQNKLALELEALHTKRVELISLRVSPDSK